MRTGPLRLLARLGYGARGVVYLLVGGLSLSAAIAVGGGQATDSEGALAGLTGDPFGIAALVAIGFGLFGYSLWRCAQAFLDADHHGRDAKGLVVRGGLLVSAVTHVMLGGYAFSLALGTAGGSGGGSKGAATWVMQQPFGRYLLGIVAVAIMGAGAAQFWKGASGGFRKQLALGPDLERILSPVCTFGLIARGIVFAIIGSFFLYAAFMVDPDQAGGLTSALRWVRSQSYGSILFAGVAAGLLAFGIYGIIQAIWRRIDIAAPLRQARRAGRIAQRAAR